MIISWVLESCITIVVPHKNLHWSRCLGIYHGLHGMGYVSASSIGIRSPHFCIASLTFTELHLCHSLLRFFAAHHHVSAELRFSHHLQSLHPSHTSSVRWTCPPPSVLNKAGTFSKRIMWKCESCEMCKKCPAARPGVWKKCHESTFGKALGMDSAWRPRNEAQPIFAKPFGNLLICAKPQKSSRKCQWSAE